MSFIYVFLHISSEIRLGLSNIETMQTGTTFQFSHGLL